MSSEDVKAEPFESQRPELATHSVEGRVPGSTAVRRRRREAIRSRGVNPNRWVADPKPLTLLDDLARSQTVRCQVLISLVSGY